MLTPIFLSSPLSDAAGAGAPPAGGAPCANALPVNMMLVRATAAAAKILRIRDSSAAQDATNEELIPKELRRMIMLTHRVHSPAIPAVVTLA